MSMSKIECEQISDIPDIHWDSVFFYDFSPNKQSPLNDLKGSFGFFIEINQDDLVTHGLDLRGITDVKTIIMNNFLKSGELIYNISNQQVITFEANKHLRVGRLSLVVENKIMLEPGRSSLLFTEMRRSKLQDVFVNFIVASPGLMDLLRRKDQDGFSGSIEKERNPLIDSFDDLAYMVYKNNGSDIHIEARENKAHIRYRQNGLLKKLKDVSFEHAESLARTIYNSLFEPGSRGSNNFDSKSRQNCVIMRSYEGIGNIRFRFASMPIAPSGFDVVLRLLPIGINDSKILEAENMGYTPRQGWNIRRMIGRASGMSIIAGTTGSGKSTSLKNFLEKMAEDKPGIKIRTIEDPVEYRIRGTHQTPVAAIEGDASAFQGTLRAAMRMDPDVIMVGEIRDAETATLVIQAVQTGHQVLTTLHANSALGILDRLSTIGIDRRVLAQSGLISGLMYQRLVPVLCSHCKVHSSKAYHDEHIFQSKIFERLAVIGVKPDDPVFFRNKEGCHHCKGTGYTGRKVCAEIVAPNSRLLKAFSSHDAPLVWSLWRGSINKQNNIDIENHSDGMTAFEVAVHRMKKGVFSPMDIEDLFMQLDELLTLDELFGGD